MDRVKIVSDKKGGKMNILCGVNSWVLFFFVLWFVLVEKEKKFRCEDDFELNVFLNFWFWYEGVMNFELIKLFLFLFK